MAEPRPSRRQTLCWALCAPLAATGFARAAAAQAPVCVDLDTLPSGQKGMRRSLGFKLVSPDPARHCSICTFFKGSTTGCGTCQLLSGGAVSANSVCESWTAKG